MILIAIAALLYFFKIRLTEEKHAQIVKQLEHKLSAK